MSIKGYFSQSIDVLLLSLMQNRYLPEKKVFFVVPNEAYRTWLIESIAQLDNSNVFWGNKILFLEEAFSFFKQFSSLKQLPLISSSNLLLQTLKALQEDSTFVFDRKNLLHAKQMALCLHHHLLHQVEPKGALLQKTWKKIFPCTSPIFSHQEIFFSEDIQYFSVHLLGFQWMPEMFFSFFSRLVCPTFFYHFSPTSIFWQDVPSSKSFAREQAKHLQQEKAKKSPTKEKLFLHPLLSEWGEISRRIFTRFEDIYPEGCYPLYEQPSCLLHHLQQDLVQGKETFSKLVEDSSLQLFSVGGTILREVETLKEVLLVWFQDHPEESVTVLAPDLQKFLPVIDAVFGGDSFFHISIQDSGVFEASAFLQGLQHLMHCLLEDFKSEAFGQLCYNTAFQRRWNVLQPLFLQNLLQKQGWHFGFENPTSKGQHTLAYVLEETLKEEVFYHETFSSDRDEKESFSSIVEFFFCVEKDRKWVQELRSAKQWKDFFLRVQQDYFLVEEQDPAHNIYQQCCLDTFHDEQVLLSFAFAWELLQDKLQQKKFSEPCSYRPNVFFRNLQEGHVYPSAFIYLLGMDEESFPSSERRSHLEEVSLQKNPLSQHKQKHAFFMTLFAAKKKWAASFLHTSCEDGQELHPSLCVQQLQLFLRQAYQVFEESWRQKIPDDPCDPSLFSLKSFWMSHDERMFFACKSFLQPHIHQSSFFSSPQPLNVVAESKVYSMKDLSMAFTHPLKFFIQKVLGVFLPYEETSSFLYPSALSLVVAKKEAFSADSSTAVSHLQEQGKWPLGLMAESVKDQVDMEDTMRKILLKEKGLFLKDKESLQFSLQGEEEFCHVTFQVKIEHVIQDWILWDGKKESKTLFALYPILIALQLYRPSIDKVFFLGDGKTYRFFQTDASKQWKHLIQHFFLSLYQPSFLFPFLWEALHMKSFSLFQQRLQIKQSQMRYQDPYWKWAWKNEIFSIEKDLFYEWAEYAKKRFPNVEKSYERF